MRFLAFDIETYSIIPSGTHDFTPYRPLGITCAALLPVDGEKMFDVELFYGDSGKDMLDETLSGEGLFKLFESLRYWADNGFLPATWNGLKFDFDILAEELSLAGFSDTSPIVANLAMNQYDLAYQMLCEVGYMTSLDSAAKGMGLAGKLDGMTGSQAPFMWRKSREEQQKVLEYVKQDVVTTAELFISVLAAEELVWTSKAGKRCVWNPKISVNEYGKTFLSPRDCFSTPKPDVSWMSTPLTRESCLAWARNILY